jgi:hypothetical protein
MNEEGELAGLEGGVGGAVLENRVVPSVFSHLEQDDAKRPS